MRLAGLEIDLPVYARAAFYNDNLAAAYGLAWSKGECWVWFGRFGEFPEGFFPLMMSEIKRTFRAAKQLGETVIYTARDREYETSERFLKAMKFRHEGERNGEELWVRSL
jgi:hypothetical protein